MGPSTTARLPFKASSARAMAILNSMTRTGTSSFGCLHFFGNLSWLQMLTCRPDAIFWTVIIRLDAIVVLPLPRNALNASVLWQGRQIFVLLAASLTSRLIAEWVHDSLPCRCFLGYD